ncbi:MAG: tRNA pseudouridine(38-40) synthase TruA [Deltaproteobacteria bacterium]|nr:tRNA pseudouridine(38-40) synthase TruA [Deltaproteobacteria bacterium]
MLRSIALLLEYDGRDFCGWQQQPRQRSVQGVVQAAVQQMTREVTALVGASRTDAGVHAVGQVAHFQTRTAIPAVAFALGLNQHLPRDVRVRAAVEVPATFHARHRAVRKIYRYLMHMAATPSALLGGRLWHRCGGLRIAAMHAAAQRLCGAHDFRAFCASNDRSQHQLRRLERCTVRRVSWDRLWPAYAPQPGHVLVIECVGNGFLKQMVRNIVGTLVEVGEGKRSPASMRSVLQSRDRRQAGATAPAEGLYLVKVEYEPPLW